MQLLFGFAISRAIGVSAELRVADLLRGGPKSAEELARRTGTHARSLYRVLRACASAGVFAEDDEKRFGLTPLAEPLLSDAPGSLRAFFAMMTTTWQFETWAHLPYSVRTGKPAFDEVHGMSSFDYFWTNQEAGKEFNDAMTSNSAFASDAVVSSHDFSAATRLVDVGGGHGLLLASILKKYPHMRGVLFDVPAVVEQAKDLLDASGVGDRCERVGGDFFAKVPEGGDTYILKHVVHDWDDEQSAKILQNCREAMQAGGSVLVMEVVLPEGNEPSIGKLLDLQMMLYLPGCERTEAEYRALFDRAGLELTRVIPTMSPFSIIEGARK